MAANAMATISFFYDEGHDDDSDSNSLTSVTPSIRRGVDEGGRTFACYGRHEYGMPMDKVEQHRLNMCHVKYSYLLGHRRFMAPIPILPQRILDLGCGTGRWCINIADQYPSAEIIGTDIAPIQSEWVPPNCRFEIDDIELEWTWRKASFDLIFARDLVLCIRDFPQLFGQCFTHLKPGGWVEFQGFAGILGCDDDSVPPDSTLGEFNDTILESSAIYGAPLDDPWRWRGWMLDQGFVNVTQRMYKLPCNPWCKDPRLRTLGYMERQNLDEGLDAMMLRMLRKTNDWTIEETHEYLDDVRKEIRDTKHHVYWPYVIVTAQRPYY